MSASEILGTAVLLLPGGVEEGAADLCSGVFFGASFLSPQLPRRRLALAKKARERQRDFEIFIFYRSLNDF
jgi:hypothetical protein